MQGQLGDRSRKSSSVPISVSSGGTQMIVTAGMDSSMSMSLSGTIYTWGTGKYGQTGSGANSATLLFPEPLKVKDTGRFVYVASGHRHSLAVNDKGEVFAWGLESGKSFREAGDLTAQVKFKLVDEGDYSPGEYSIPKEGYSLSYYSDEKEVDEWAAPYVAFAHDNKIILGTNGKFDPRGNITKEQALLIVARMIKRYGWSA